MLFAYRLAAHLGIEDPIEMIRRMTPEALTAWMAFDALEPIGMRGVWNQLAMVLQSLLARSGVESSAEDFVPGYKPED